MSVYLVSYDLKTPGRHYTELYKQLSSVPNCHPLESVWLIDVQQTATQIRDTLQGSLDTNDTLLVVRFNKEWGSIRLQGMADWLQNRTI